MKLKRGLRPAALFATMFLVLGGTPYGIEEIVPRAGPGLSILVLAAMALLWAAPYSLLVAELVNAMPLEGGLYPWFRASFGRFWSFVFSYLDWLSWVLDSCLYPPLIAAYLLSFLLPAPDRWTSWGVCLVVIWLLTWLNIRGIDLVGRVSQGLAWLTALPLLLLAVLGWPHVSLERLFPLAADTPWHGSPLTHALVWSMWTFSGYEVLANASEEIVEPERNYPRLLALLLPVSVLAHVLPLAVGLGATPDWRAWDTAHFNQVALAVGGIGFAAFMALSGQLAGLGLFNGELLVNSRRPFAMARDGMLPVGLGRLHPRHGTPHVALIVQAVLYSVLTLVMSFSQLLFVSTWMSVPAYLMTFAAPLVLRARHPELRGRFRIPGGWPVLVLTALAPSAIALYVLFRIEWDDVLVGSVLIATGPVLYGVMAAWRRLRPGAFEMA